MLKLMLTMNTVFRNRRSCCICFICVLCIVIICYQWILSAGNSAKDFVTTLHVHDALDILNAVESNASWILTISNGSFISSSSLYNVKKGVSDAEINHVLHNISSSSVPNNVNSRIGSGHIFQIMNYTHDSLLRQDGSNLDSDINQLNAETRWTVRKNVMADEFVLKSNNNHELPTQQTVREINMKASASGLVNVVAMSLYGSEMRYTAGVIRNAYLVRQNFPGWQLWVYIESPLSSKYPAVPEDVISRLVSVGVEVHYISPEDDMIPPMMWRFLVADDAGVDWFIVRDADSRLTLRDAAAVAAWIKSDSAFHCIRDHPSHAAYAVSGGLWGGRAPLLRLMLRKSWATMMHGVAAGYLNDMNFLNSIVWPRVERHAYCVDSVSCDHWPNAFPFPVRRRGYEHVGQVYDEHDIPRHDDVQILKRTLENRNCIPP